MIDRHHPVHRERDRLPRPATCPECKADVPLRVNQLVATCPNCQHVFPVRAFTMKR